MRHEIMTASGRMIDPFRPRPESICIHDICHQLSKKCRFSGACDPYYSVAEHCVRCARIVMEWGNSRRVGLQALLHDAAEAYLVDVPSPIKRRDDMLAYRAAETELQYAIFRRFRVPDREFYCVKAADGIMLATESRDLMPNVIATDFNPQLETIIPYTMDEAARAFMGTYECLS